MAGKVIVVGGGLSGLSAAHTVLERGGRILLLDKNSFLGGNSTKATSGINGAGTKQQRALGINDSAEIFEFDTAKSANSGKEGIPINALGKVLTHDGGPAVEWLTDSFGLDLSLISRLGGHSQPRTHRGKERFPGMTITYALMEKLEEIAKNTPERAKVVTGAKVTGLVTDQKTGAVIGCNYEMRDGKTGIEYGPVIIATGGYAADFSADSLLRKYRPDLLDMGLPTTNGEHCTGDGIKFAQAIGAAGKDLEHVQVHPTGLVHPDEPEAKVKFLAAEALRGVGGLLLNKDGDRFCNELGTRDYVTGCMWKNAKGPYRLVLNSKCGKEIEWHCKHYTGRGLMKHYTSGAALAQDMGISADKLGSVYESYNTGAQANKDEHGRKYFQNMPFSMDDSFWVAIVCPVLHYCMGGLEITPESECVATTGKVIPGLYCCGEAAGGVHGKNRLGGSSLLDCVVFGRVAGATASRYLLNQLLANPASAAAPGGSGGAVGVGKTGIGATITQGGVVTSIAVDPAGKKVTMELAWGDANVSSGTTVSTTPAAAAASAPAPAQQKSAEAAPSAAASAPAAPSGGKAALKEYTIEEVNQHNKEKDCWVVVNGEVLDVTNFMKDHPGGKQAILLFAGKDATAEFNMLHKPDVVAKYAPNSIIGTLKGGSKGAISAHATSAAAKVTHISSHL